MKLPDAMHGCGQRLGVVLAILATVGILIATKWLHDFDPGF